MKRFKKILHITEAQPKDRAALRRAIWLAKKNGARLTVGAITESLPHSLRTLATEISPDELEDLAREETLHSMRKFARPSLNGSGIDVEFRVFSGTPFVETIREVLRNEHDLVIQGAESEGGLKQRLFGTTTMHLMRKCPCPVWAVKPTRRRSYSRVLAAVSNSVDDPVGGPLNGKILELANSLAALEGGTLHVVHAWSLYGESLLRGRAHVPDTEIIRLLRETQAQRRRMLDRLLEPLPAEGLERHTHLVKGRPEEVIPRIARERRIEIIVMGTVSRTGVAGLLIGNTAERILNRVDCSVLAVKPEGFVTPVQLPDE